MPAARFATVIEMYFSLRMEEVGTFEASQLHQHHRLIKPQTNTFYLLIIIRGSPYQLLSATSSARGLASSNQVGLRLLLLNHHFLGSQQLLLLKQLTH
jgi:hypothetical protein